VPSCAWASSLETLTYANGLRHVYRYDSLNRLRGLQGGVAVPGRAGLASVLQSYNYRLRASGHRSEGDRDRNDRRVTDNQLRLRRALPDDRRTHRRRPSAFRLGRLRLGQSGQPGITGLDGRRSGHRDGRQQFGSQMGRIQMVHGLDGLYRWIEFYFKIKGSG
jgi:hypothetical protein